MQSNLGLMSKLCSAKMQDTCIVLIESGSEKKMLGGVFWQMRHATSLLPKHFFLWLLDAFIFCTLHVAHAQCSVQQGIGTI